MVNPGYSTRHASPINPEVYGYLALAFLLFGIFFAGWLFVNEVTSHTMKRKNIKELLISVFASTFMGFGGLFLFLAVGIYV